MTTERIMLGFLLVGVAYGCGVVLWPFLSAILWAAILTFTTWPLFKRLRRRIPPVLAAVTMMIICAVAIVLPLALLTSTGIQDLPAATASITAGLAHFRKNEAAPLWIAHIPYLGGKLTALYTEWTRDIGSIGATIRPYAGQIARYTISVLIQIAGGLVELVMALFIAFFFWLNGDALGRVITSLLRRVTGDYAYRLIDVIGSVVRGTVYGILGTAIIQGVLTTIGMMLCGVPEAGLLGGCAAFVAVFPVGAPIVWVPTALWLILNGSWAKGLFLAIYGVIIISGADHIIRPAFVARGAQLPYLLTVLGVLGGVITLGGVGIFIGPVLLGVGYTLTTEFASGAYAQTRPDTL